MERFSVVSTEISKVIIYYYWLFSKRMPLFSVQRKTLFLLTENLQWQRKMRLRTLRMWQGRGRWNTCLLRTDLWELSHLSGTVLHVEGVCAVSSLWHWRAQRRRRRFIVCAQLHALQCHPRWRTRWLVFFSIFLSLDSGGIRCVNNFWMCNFALFDLQWTCRVKRSASFVMRLIFAHSSSHITIIRKRQPLWWKSRKPKVAATNSNNS